MNENDILETKQYYLDFVAKFCSQCGAPYSVDDVSILHKNGVSAIIHFNCRVCKSRNVISTLNDSGMSGRVRFETDLEVTELSKFIHRRSLKLQDILDLYSGVKDKSKVKI